MQVIMIYEDKLLKNAIDLPFNKGVQIFLLILLYNT